MIACSNISPNPLPLKLNGIIISFINVGVFKLVPTYFSPLCFQMFSKLFFLTCFRTLSWQIIWTVLHFLPNLEKTSHVLVSSFLKWKGILPLLCLVKSGKKNIPGSCLPCCGRAITGKPLMDYIDLRNEQ